MKPSEKFDKFIGQRVEVDTTEHTFFSLLLKEEVTSLIEKVRDGDPVFAELEELADEDGMFVHPELRSWRRDASRNLKRINVVFENREDGFYIKSLHLG